jgi:hypothetical protein
MPGLATMTIVGLIVAAALVLYFLKVRQKDLVSALMEKRRASSRLVSRADYVEGVEQIPVALSLTNTALYYENPDLEASFDLDRLDEIEYSGELATGRAVPNGCRVLRLRSHGTAFEFVMENAEAAKWAAALPARSYGQPTAQAV